MARRIRRRRSKLRAIAELIGRVHPRPADVDAARVMAAWSRVLPEKIVARARPVALTRGVLFVNVTSSAWAQELHHMHDELLTRLREAVKGARLAALRFKVGPLPDIVHRPRRPKPPPPVEPLEVLPDTVGRALAALPDDELRDRIARAAAVSLAASARRRRNG